jgi:hypothetical protein
MATLTSPRSKVFVPASLASARKTMTFILSLARASGPPPASSSGVQQRDVLGPTLFALGVHPVLREMSRRFPNVRVWGYVDDITLSAMPEHHAELFAACRFAASAFALLGLQLNMRSWRPVRELTSAVARKLGFQAGTDGKMWIKVLGAIIGSDEVAAVALGVVSEQQCALLDRLRNVPAQEAFSLQTRFAVPRFTYHCRVHPPATSVPAAQHFDSRIWAAFLEIADIPGPRHLLACWQCYLSLEEVLASRNSATSRSLRTLQVWTPPPTRSKRALNACSTPSRQSSMSSRKLVLGGWRIPRHLRPKHSPPPDNRLADMGTRPLRHHAAAEAGGGPPRDSRQCFCGPHVACECGYLATIGLWHDHISGCGW